MVRTDIWETYIGINEFKKCFQPRTNLVKDENGDLLAGSHTIFTSWRIASVSYWMYMVLMMLDKNAYSWAISTLT
jgi:hypothetical protein